ncbi:MAG: hypothetical protein AB7T06_34880 [Kofleriaceae bacterium]
MNQLANQLAIDRLHACEVCAAKVSELRRGRCWGCYARWVDARPVGMGAKCVTCSEKRRKVLRAVELFGSWKPMCFNCSGQLLTLNPMPNTIADLRIAVSRERRRNDRRIGKADTRVFRYERRVGERRTEREDIAPIDDDMIIEVSVSMDPEPVDFEDLTSIRELVTHLRRSELAG